MGARDAIGCGHATLPPTPSTVTHVERRLLCLLRLLFGLGCQLLGCLHTPRQRPCLLRLRLILQLLASTSSLRQHRPLLGTLRGEPTCVAASQKAAHDGVDLRRRRDLLRLLLAEPCLPLERLALPMPPLDLGGVHGAPEPQDGAQTPQLQGGRGGSSAHGRGQRGAATRVRMMPQ